MLPDRYNKWSTTLVFMSLLLLTQQTASADSNSSTSTTAAPTTASTTTSRRYDNPLVEHKHERNCKALCEHCGCLGFYCGEECICECNDDSSDTECIRTMQVNARTLNTPFEILIQGPSNNRFVRNARQFDQQRELVPRSAGINKTTRNRRSTITIYKPSSTAAEGKRAALSFNALVPAVQTKKSEQARHKRSVEHLEWFNDFANSWVRPSPLGTRAQQAKAAAFKRQAAAAADSLPRPNREPWFLEQTAPRLTRPAPLFKRQQSSQDDSQQRSRKSKKMRPASIEEDESEKDEAPTASGPEIRPLRDALQVVERIPRVLQDTVTHLAADNNAGDVFSLNIMDDVRPKKISRKDANRIRRRLRERKRDMQVIPTIATRAPLALPPPAPLPPGGLLLPWLRQQRLKLLRGEQNFG